MNYSKYLNYYESILYKRAAIYIRCSKEEQALSGETIETQKELLIEFSKIHNLKIIDFFIDEGHTARKKYSKRKEFMRMMKDVEHKKFDIIVFTKLDRWFRNVSDYYKIQEILESHDISWLTAQERYETETTNGRLNVNIRLSVAQDEADRTSDRIKVVFDHKVNKGELISGSLPIGLKNINGKAEIDKETAPIVLDLFEHFELNHSKRGAMIYLMEKYNIYLTYASVSRMLTNELYKGVKRTNENFCPALISPNRFNQIQLFTQRNVRQHATNRFYIFTGLLCCSECNHSLIAHTTVSKKYNKEYISYRCNMYHISKICSHKKTLSEPFIESLILEIIRPTIKSYITDYEVNSSIKKPSDSALIKLNNKISNIKELYINGYLEFEEFKSRHDDLKSQIDSLNMIPKLPNFDNLQRFLSYDIEGVYKNFSSQEKRSFWASILKKFILTVIIISLILSFYKFLLINYYL